MSGKFPGLLRLRIGGEIGDETFDQVEPDSRLLREMNLKAWMFCRSSRSRWDAWGWRSYRRWDARIWSSAFRALAQEIEPLDMVVTLPAAGDD